LISPRRVGDTFFPFVLYDHPSVYAGARARSTDRNGAVQLGDAESSVDDRTDRPCSRRVFLAREKEHGPVDGLLFEQPGRERHRVSVG
jgi:hypothetical protein